MEVYPSNVFPGMFCVCLFDQMFHLDQGELELLALKIQAILESE